MAVQKFNRTKEGSSMWIGYLGGEAIKIPCNSVISITYLGGIGSDTTAVIEYMEGGAK